MSNSFFKFKQFTVQQDRCAMKVGTDGALLGAWADCEGANRILDIGSGTGLISLMLAQRSELSEIQAIDIDEGAYRQSVVNFENSIFSGRISVLHTAFQEFSTDDKFDLIVSNPPFFSDSLKSPDRSRNAARHNDVLPPEYLIARSVELMSPRARLAVIIPTDRFADFHRLALQNQLFPCRQTTVFSLPHKPPKRILLEYANYSVESRNDSLLIETSPRQYSEEFIDLMKQFYLILP